MFDPRQCIKNQEIVKFSDFGLYKTKTSAVCVHKIIKKNKYVKCTLIAPTYGELGTAHGTVKFRVFFSPKKSRKKKRLL